MICVSQARKHWNSTTRWTRFFALPETMGCQNEKYNAIACCCSQTKSAEDLMLWTIAQMAAAVGSKPGGALNPVARLAGVSIDSRTVRPGELFIAIHGPRHDGHDHVPAALEPGAVAAVVAGGWYRATPAGSLTAASRWPTPSRRSNNSRKQYAKRGAEKLPASL